MDNYIAQVFLQHITTDYKRRFQTIIEAPDAFKPTRDRGEIEEKTSNLSISISSTHQTQDHSNFVNIRPVFQSAIGVLNLVRELFTDVATMPKYANDFSAIIDTILRGYFEVCEKKHVEIIENTETGSKLENPDFITLLRSDPLFKTLTESNDKDGLTIVDERER